jgi:D-sedoheptulose 7-phosphate isomerase
MSKYQQTIDEALEVLQSLKELEPVVEVAAGWCVETLGTGHKLLLCGNGGSAAEAQHLAGELVGRYTVNRRALPAIALSADAFEFEQVFSRQIAALGSPGDLLVAFSTSGNSPNVVAALEAAKSLGMRSIALLGSDGGRARELAGCAVVVRHPKTARAQEGHQFLVHCLMDRIEAAIAPESAA